jgi:hypothetical protein
VKKLMLLVIAVCALSALVAPGLTYAAKLTQPAGTLVPKGTTLVGTSTNVITKTTLGEIKCKKVTINALVEVNNGNTFVLVMDGAKDKAQECEVVGVGAVTISPTFTEIVAAGAGPGTIGFDFTVTGLCTAMSVSPTSVTWTGTSVIHISAGISGCGTGTLTGDVSLETTSGAAVIAET